MIPQSSIDPSAEPTRLQRELAARIIELTRADGLAVGARLAEAALADRLQVSRTPVRAALAHLAALGLAAKGERGYVLARDAGQLAALEAPADGDETERLSVAIAQDRIAGRLPDEVSETDLMRRYSVSRAAVQRVLATLAEVALAERKPGHGWKFLPAIYDPRTRAESFRFRRLIEPAGLLEPGFRLDPAWTQDMIRRHRAMLDAPWRETASVALFHMNAEFHEGLAAASGNRYLLMAVQQQNRLRRFANYDWVYGEERVVTSCTEHLEMLERLLAGENDVAAIMMRRHLERASLLIRTGDADASA